MLAQPGFQFMHRLHVMYKLSRRGKGTGTVGISGTAHKLLFLIPLQNVMFLSQMLVEPGRGRVDDVALAALVPGTVSRHSLGPAACVGVHVGHQLGSGIKLLGTVGDGTPVGTEYFRVNVLHVTT